MYIYNVYSVKLNNEVTIRRIIVWIQPSNINQDSSKTSMYPFLQTLKEQNSKCVPNNHQSIYCLCNWRPWCLLFDERVPQNLPSRERTYPYQGTSEDDFHFPQVGYVSSKESNKARLSSEVCGFINFAKKTRIETKNTWCFYFFSMSSIEHWKRNTFVTFHC